MSRRTESFRTAALVAGLASVAVLSLGLLFVVADGSRNGQSPTGGGALSSAEAASGKPAKSSNCPICGTVEAIRILEVRAETAEAGIESSRPAGVAAGRPGNDNSSMTLLEIAGTFFSGSNSGESVTRKRNAYRVTVRMDDGSYRALSLSNPPPFAVGDKVRVIEGKLVRA